MTNNYIAGGKDGYLTFNNVSSSLVVGTAEYPPPTSQSRIVNPRVLS